MGAHCWEALSYFFWVNVFQKISTLRPLCETDISFSVCSARDGRSFTFVSCTIDHHFIFCAHWFTTANFRLTQWTYELLHNKWNSVQFNRVYLTLMSEKAVDLCHTLTFILTCILNFYKLVCLRTFVRPLLSDKSIIIKAFCSSDDFCMLYTIWLATLLVVY